MYFNIHTHNKTFSNNTDGIISLFPNETEKLYPNLNYSIGIHPSFIPDSNQLLKDELDIVKEFAKKENIIAIGEIGLDKYSKTPFDIQRALFLEQLKIAEEFNKPVIIHCVRYFLKIITLKTHSSVPWIVHGFRGKPALASQLLKKGIYLSFGSALLKHSTPFYSTILNTPSDRIFLETDTSKIDIKQIYEKVADIKKSHIDTLIKEIDNNKKRIFKPLIDTNKHS